MKAVIFDIDNTLYSYDDAHAAAFAALTEYACRTLGITPEMFQELHASADRLLTARCGGGCAAVHNRLIRYQLILELLERPIGLAPEMAACYWSTLIDHMRPAEGLHETIGALKAMGLRVGIGTNMTADWQFEKLKRLGIMDQVDLMVTSEEVSAEKPDARLFQCCAEKAGCPVEACAFVGDSLRGDALGARDAGMRGIWLCPHGGEAVPGVYRIASLAELPALITTLQHEGVRAL